jgi:NitT/TauT family transport system ATP-binding protein
MASQVSRRLRHQDPGRPRPPCGTAVPASAAELNICPPAQEVTPRGLHRFQEVWLAYNDELLAQGAVRRRGHQPAGRRGRVHRHRRPVGCGKSTFMKLATGLKHAQPRLDRHRRAGGDRAAQDQRHGVSGTQPAALAHHAGQRAAAAGDRRALPLQLQAPGAPSTRKARASCSLGWAWPATRTSSRGSFPGGMQQRASICRALVHEPKMLLLDEPFGALDAFTREELWCNLRDLQAGQKFNVILVTHDLRESVFLADTVYVMSKSPGRFVVTARDRPAAPARPGGHLHAALHRHRARVARPHRGHPRRCRPPAREAKAS